MFKSRNDEASLCLLALIYFAVYLFSIDGRGVVFGGGEPLLQAVSDHKFCMNNVACHATPKKRIYAILISKAMTIVR